ncbi:MAG: CsgG/HfaB family protein [Desulfopila sp.]|jgi:curli biogenesis system outer membrane secretion channel CsgG|nr:CsgG/HfaB family protein [Desulfopila sp.]
MQRKNIFYISLIIILLFLTTSIAAATDIPEPPPGNLKYSITVTKFANESSWRGQWTVGDGFTTAMTDLLHQSGWFIVLGDSEMRQEAMQEQDFAASGRTAGGKKTPKIGRMTPAQLLVRGSITNVQDTGSKGGGVNLFGVRVGGDMGHSEMDITIYLVDSETGQVKASQKVTGKSTNKGFSVGGRVFPGIGANFGAGEKDNVQKAAEDAIAQAIVFLIGQLDSIPWEGTVILVKDGKIIVNRGSRDGVQVGTRFSVGSIEELIDPDTGEVLDRDMTQIATLTVTSVKEKIAYCAVESSQGNIEKGMTIFALK